jgi:hypothetical protein
MVEVRLRANGANGASVTPNGVSVTANGASMTIVNHGG